jgi:hypothetical protein
MKSKYEWIIYFILGLLFWIIIDWGTAGGFRISYLEKYGFGLLISYIGYPLIFTILIYIFKFGHKQLFIATFIAMLIIEVIFVRNPLLIRFPLNLIGIPIAIAVYLPLTYFPLWIVRREIRIHKNIVIICTLIEILIIINTIIHSK